MTDILCRWLNDEVKLSRKIDVEDFASDFSNGYLIGEVLHIHGLQDDFPSFSQSSTSDSKLNNFTRIEPTMALLGIPFDTNLAKDIICRKPGVATRLLYQLFISLGKKSKMNLTGVAMETMRPRGVARLSTIESDLYKERLKTLVPRQVDLDFDDLVERYHQQQKSQMEKAITYQLEEEERLQKFRKQKREEGLKRSQQIREKQNDVMERIKEATVKIAKPPNTRKKENSRSSKRASREAQDVYQSIDEFESNLNTGFPPTSPLSVDKSSIDTQIDVFLNGAKKTNELSDTKFKSESNWLYINKIRNKLNQDTQARKEREKRRRRVLVEQMKANEAQEDAKREEMLVNRLMRQSQMERRIAVQLMQVRHEKEVMKQNRLLREQQFTERRVKDFDDALAREAEMCRQAKIDYADELRKSEEVHAAIAAKRAQEKYEKHFKFCKEVLSNIIDFACKVGEYRELTERSLPVKLVREWKAMLIGGYPLFEDGNKENVDGLDRGEDTSMDSQEKLLDEEDFEEYQQSTGEWRLEVFPEDNGAAIPNAIMGHLLKRLFDIVYPPSSPIEIPQFPPCPIKACVLGKFFCGKTTAIQHITATHRVVSLDIEILLKEAVAAFQNGEMTSIDTSASQEGKDDPAITTPINNKTSDPQISHVLIDDGTKKNDAEVGEASIEADMNEAGQKEDENTITVVKDGVNDPKVVAAGEAPDSITSAATTPVSKTVMSVDSIKSGPIQPEASARAKLGGKALQYMKKGRQVPDATLVEIVLNAIRAIPEGTGWILDSFPATLNQAKLLEKGLTGYESSPSPTKMMKPDIKKTRKSRIAPDPAPTPISPAPKSGFDLVLYFDLDDAVILKRAEGRTYDPQTLEEFHEEFKSPPVGGYTGVLGRAEVNTVMDQSHDKEQVQSRLTGFQDTWPKMEKWFNKFKTLTKLSVDKSPDEVFFQMENIIEETLAKINLERQQALEQAKQEASQKAPTDETEGPGPAKSELKAEEGVSTIPAVPAESPVPTTQVPDTKGQKQNPKEQKVEMKKGGKKEGKQEGGRVASPGNKKEKDKKEKERDRSATPSKENKSSSKRGSRSPSPSKGSRPGSKQGSRPTSKSGRRSKSPAKVEELPQEDVTPHIEGPLPGSADWEYVDQQIDEEIAGFLVPKWEDVEAGYIDACKGIFRNIRDEKEKMIRYFYNTRKGYVEFLQRPDTKQEFVEEWQKGHNTIEEDLREDEEAKAEHHERVEELCVRLWDICDTRKEEAEHERQRIMTEGWLEDRTGILINHYLSLMQTEVDRYHDSCTLARDYYIAMEEMDAIQRSKVISAFASHLNRLPLIELPPISISSKESERSLTQETKPLSAKGSRDKDRNRELKTPENVEADEENKRRIPLVPRRPKSSESPGKEKKEKKTTPRKEKSEEKGDSPTLVMDNDERLLFDAQQAAYQIIEVQVTQSQSDDLALSKQPDEKEKDLQKSVSKGKKEKKQGGRKSAGKSMSKAQLVETPPPVKEENVDTQSEEEQKKKEMKEKALREYRALISIESDRLRSRIDLIKAKATAIITEWKTKAEITYGDMEDWLGRRFLDEIESIDTMAKLLRLAIEGKDKIQDAIVLQDKDFIVEIDLHTFRTPSPPPPSPPIETAYKDAFTVVQLYTIYHQLLQTAPTGVISVRAFCDTFQDLAACSDGIEILPDCWMSVTSQQLLDISTMLSWDQENIDWRAFLVAAAHPYPEITNSHLLNLLATFIVMDTTKLGRIRREDYQLVFLFGQSQELNVKELEDCYDRLSSLQEFFFDVFAKEHGGQQWVDYKIMLQYLSVHTDPLDGFLRALSVVTNQAMPLSNEIEVKEESDGDQMTWRNQIPANMLASVHIDDLLQVFNLNQRMAEDTNRFATSKEFLKLMSRDKLTGIYDELRSPLEECVPLHLLYQHPVMKEYIHGCHKYKLANLAEVFKENEKDGFV